MRPVPEVVGGAIEEHAALPTAAAPGPTELAREESVTVARPLTAGVQTGVQTGGSVRRGHRRAARKRD